MLTRSCARHNYEHCHLPHAASMAADGRGCATAYSPPRRGRPPARPAPRRRAILCSLGAEPTESFKNSLEKPMCGLLWCSQRQTFSSGRQPYGGSLRKSLIKKKAACGSKTLLWCSPANHSRLSTLRPGFKSRREHYLFGCKLGALRQCHR